MADFELPTVVTAIADASVESFVASTLFGQGWSVIFRAIDIDTLETFTKNQSTGASNAILIFAPDLPGITEERLELLTPLVKQTIGLGNQPPGVSNLENLHTLPTTATDLVSLIRGFIRVPMLHKATSFSNQKRKAYVLALGSAGSNTGCTTLAINIAMELSVLEKTTLLIDANFRAPSIAALLALRNVNGDAGWRDITPSLAIAEITQNQETSVDELMEKAVATFDRVVIDLGSISGLSNRLTDRRWTSSMTTWTCDQGDEMMVVARPDFLGLHRLGQVSALIEKTSIRSALSFTLNMKSVGRRGNEEETKFLSITTPLQPLRVRSLTRDSRAIDLAQNQKSTLIEVNERSNLRKSIAKIASEIEH